MIGAYLAWALIALGVLMIVRTVTAGGGVAAVGIVLGLAFVVAGALRLWLQTRQ